MANKNWKKTTAALGLSLCLALPGCAVEDNPGGGSIFTIILP